MLHKSHQYVTILCFAIVLFTTAVAIRYPLVDKCYRYSFEPDSEPCVEETRSFYFFFKNPSLENAPHTLTAYPNYSDGQFITSAIFANVVRGLCKAGIIKTNLSDSDFSIIIYSMRWAGVLFDATALVLVFFSLILLTQNLTLSFTIGLLYYLFNMQTLGINFIRTDHYTLFVGNLMFLASLLLYLNPYKKQYYILAGFAAGLVSATKINFPFYLFVLLGIILVMIWQKRGILLYAIYLIAAFLITFAFMYFRWLMYAENIFEVVKITIGIGHIWLTFWGNNNYNYYIWDQFFGNGFSIGVVIFLIVFYISFVWCVVSSLINRNPLKLTLCLVFIVQMLLLAFSPKVPRYAVIVPTYVSIFIGIALQSMVNYINSNLLKVTMPALVIMPMFLFSVNVYSSTAKKANYKAESINNTRVPAYKWMRENIKPGSIVAVQKPRVSNSSFFNMPFYFNFNYLKYPFLYRDKLCDFMPPDLRDLEHNVSYVILNNKETNYHYYTMDYHDCGSEFIQKWSNFYTALDSIYKPVKFASAYKNYGVNEISIYCINDSLIKNSLTDIKSKTIYKGDTVSLTWSYAYGQSKMPDYFEVQISADSNMHWLVYGSRDGFLSKYKKMHLPVFVNNMNINLVPPLVQNAFNNGDFEKVTGWKSYSEHADEINRFFTDILFDMKEKDLTFGESLALHVNDDARELISVISKVFKPQGDIMKMDVDAYMQAALPNLKPQQIWHDDKELENTWMFSAPINLQQGKKYFWRVRYRDVHSFVSYWSNTSSFTYQ